MFYVSLVYNGTSPRNFLRHGATAAAGGPINNADDYYYYYFPSPPRLRLGYWVTTNTRFAFGTMTGRSPNRLDINDERGLLILAKSTNSRCVLNSRVILHVSIVFNSQNEKKKKTKKKLRERDSNFRNAKSRSRATYKIGRIIIF